HVGVDAATKHDSAAVVAVGQLGDRLQLVRHRIWSPRRGETLDLEETIEAFLLDLAREFRVSRVAFDPSQMVRSSQALATAGLPPEASFVPDDPPPSWALAADDLERLRGDDKGLSLGMRL